MKKWTISAHLGALLAAVVDVLVTSDDLAGHDFVRDVFDVFGLRKG